METLGIKTRLLTNAYMPAVLCEMGFLTHPDEERHLGDSSYQRRLAKSMGLAILEYSRQVSASTPVNDGTEEPIEGEDDDD